VQALIAAALHSRGRLLRHMDRRRAALVTGATDGIGRQTAVELAKAGWKVLVHGRNRPRVEDALAHVRAQVEGAEVDGVSFDLGSLAAVRKGAGQVAEKLEGGHLDVLINNAGIFSEERVVAEDGAVEATLLVNHLGPFLLTQLLLPQLRGGGGHPPGRVINVASIAHTRGRIHFDDLSLSRGYTGYAAYAQSKLANVMHALALSDREPAEALLVYALHPGVIGTKLLRQGFGPVQGSSVGHGAKTSVALATTAEPAPTGTYFSEGVATPPARAAQDKAQRDKLWEMSLQLVG
jgi:NAD(P)-dependent dehydrogenase (short-subunit alcohol dehydrogenase family)